jgi:hypothetical protein
MVSFWAILLLGKETKLSYLGTDHLTWRVFLFRS